MDSERVAQTGASGRTLLESIGINKSLFTLRQVIQSLAEPTGQAPPYREAKLTSLLKHSLGGNSHTVMIACLSPSDTHVAENLNTLTYASKAQSIVNTPVLNLDSRSQLVESLRAENAQLKAELQHTQAALLALQSGGNPDKVSGP
jgi:kinesin family protein 4/21/27